MKQLTLFDKSIILLIIYKSFAESFEDNLFSSLKPIDLIYITLASVLLFYVVYYLIGFLSDWLRFNREDRITAQYCGTKKRSEEHTSELQSRGQIVWRLLFEKTI